MTADNARVQLGKIKNNLVALSYSDGTGLTPLLGSCLGEVLDATARAYPNALALVSCHQGERFNYAELRSVVEQFARGLLHLGIQKGDRVGIWATNCSQWIITQFATATIGAILVNINPAYRAYELKYALRNNQRTPGADYGPAISGY